MDYDKSSRWIHEHDPFEPFVVAAWLFGQFLDFVHPTTHGVESV